MKIDRCDHGTFVYIEEAKIFNLENIEEVISLFNDAFKVIEETGYIVSVVEMSQKLITFLTERASEQIHKGNFWTAEMVVNRNPGRAGFKSVGENGVTIVHHYRLRYIGNNLDYLSR